MVEPVLRTTATPLDRLTLQEWRDRIATFIGVTYAATSPAHQTEIGRLIDEAHEFISKALGHRPFLRRTTTLSLVADQELYAMPADFRTVRHVLEGTGTDLRRAILSDEEEYWDHFPNQGSGETGHDWDDQQAPHWIYRGLDDSNPPVHVFQRVPTPTSVEAGTDNVTVVYRPLMELLTTSTFNELPASLQSAVSSHVLYKWQMFNKNYEQAAAWKQDREEEIARANINDTRESEKPIEMEIPRNVMDELRLYGWR